MGSEMSAEIPPEETSQSSERFLNSLGEFNEGREVMDTIADINLDDVKDQQEKLRLEKERTVAHENASKDNLKNQESVNKSRIISDKIANERVGTSGGNVENVFNEDATPAEVEIGKYINDVQKPSVVDVIIENQKENGEQGKNLEDSPKTAKALLKKLKEFIGNNEGKALIALNVLAAVGAALGGGLSVIGDKWDSKNKPKIAKGCLRVDVNTGDISWPSNPSCGVNGKALCDKDPSMSNFCDYSQYPVTPCSATYTQCQDKPDGGCPLGPDEKTGQFTYVPVCGDMNLLYSGMDMIASNPDFFRPKKTPLFLRIISWVFIALLVTTIVWYIYKDVKKIINKPK